MCWAPKTPLSRAAGGRRFPIFCPTRFWTSQQARKLSEVLVRLLRDPGDLEDRRLDQLSDLKDALDGLIGNQAITDGSVARVAKRTSLDDGLAEGPSRVAGGSCGGAALSAAVWRRLRRARGSHRLLLRRQVLSPNVLRSGVPGENESRAGSCGRGAVLERAHGKLDEDSVIERVSDVAAAKTRVSKEQAEAGLKRVLAAREASERTA